MPIVRRPDRSVEIAPLRGGQLTAAETPASMGAGVERAKADTALAKADFGGRVAQITAGWAQKVQADERQKADQIAGLAASNKLSEWQTDFFYNPEKGAFLRQGLDAQGLPDEARASFQKATGAIEAGLSTDEQRVRFAAHASQVWESANLDVQRHVFKEQQAYGLSEMNSLIENKASEAIQHAADPKQVAVSLQTAVSALQTTGRSLGMGPQEIATKTLAIQTKVHVGVIGSLLAQDRDREAATYFAAVKGEINGDQQDNLIKAIDEGTLRGQAQKKTDEILKAGGTPKEQRDAAKAIDDPKLRDQVEQRIEHEQAVAKRDENEADQATMRASYDILDRTHDVTKIPPAVWTSLSGDARSAMRGYALRLAKGEPVETDPGTFYSLMQMARDKPADFATWNLLQYRHKLDDGDFKSLASLQLSIARSDTKAAEKELAPYDIDRQVLNDTLTTYGIDPTPKEGTPEARAIAQLRNMVRRRGDAIQAITGKKATNADIQAETDRILSQSVKVPGSWWNFWPGGKSVSDTSKRIIDITPAEIPAADRAQIEAALRARNRPVTDATVLDLYLEAQVRRKK